MRYKVGFTDNRWIGVVVDDDNTILTVCTEYTREAASNWCQHFINTGVELPDAYDRKQ